MTDRNKTSSYATAISSKAEKPKIKRTEVVIHLSYVLDESSYKTIHEKSYLMKKQDTYGPIFQHFCAKFELDRSDVIFTTGSAIAIDSDSPKRSYTTGKHSYIYVRPKVLEGHYVRIDRHIL
jgi:hypothetical protein